MKEVRLERSIWPDVDGPEEINEFLKKIGVSVNFLLDDGLLFTYPQDKLEPYKSSDATLYFKDVATRDIVFHYYEDFGYLVFEVLGEEKKLPILEFDINDW